MALSNIYTNTRIMHIGWPGLGKPTQCVLLCPPSRLPRGVNEANEAIYCTAQKRAREREREREREIGKEGEK